MSALQWGDARKALLAKDYRTGAPRHKAIGRLGIGRSAQKDIGRIGFGQTTVNIRPTPRRRQGNRRPLRAGRQTFHPNNAHTLRRLARDQRRVQPRTQGLLALGQWQVRFAGGANMKCNAHQPSPNLGMTGNARALAKRRKCLLVAEHPVRPFSLSAGRSPGLRI